MTKAAVKSKHPMVRPITFDEFRSIAEEIDFRLQPRFEALDARFEAIDARFEAIDRRFEAIDRRFEAIDARFDVIDTRFQEVDMRFDSLETKWDAKFDMIKNDLKTIKWLIPVLITFIMAIFTTLMKVIK